LDVLDAHHVQITVVEKLLIVHAQDVDSMVVVHLLVSIIVTRIVLDGVVDHYVVLITLEHVKLTVGLAVWVHHVQQCVLMHVQENAQHVLTVVDGNVVRVHHSVQPVVEQNAISHVQLTVLTLVMTTVFIVALKYVEDAPIFATHVLVCA
jgi:hypothetical protein